MRIKLFLLSLSSCLLVSCASLQTECSRSYNSIFEPTMNLLIETQADNDNVAAILSYYSSEMNTGEIQSWEQFENITSNYVANIKEDTEIAPNYPIFPSSNEVVISKMVISNATYYLKHCAYKEYVIGWVPYEMNYLLANFIFEINDYSYDNR